MDTNGHRVEAATYFEAVAGLTALAFVLLMLFVYRRRCATTTNKNCCTDALGKHQLEYANDLVNVIQDVDDIESGIDIHLHNPPQFDLNYVENNLRETHINDCSPKQGILSINLLPNDLECDDNQDAIVVVTREAETEGLLSSIEETACVEVCFFYDAPMRKMTLHVMQAKHMPQNEKGQPSQTQIRVVLLPMKKQKHKTKIRSGKNPQFMESFLFHRINPEDVHEFSVRIRVYTCEMIIRQRFVGEAIINFSALNLDLENNLWINLQPRSALKNFSFCEPGTLGRSDSVSSCSSTLHGGVAELLLGLAYNGTTGRLTVEVVKGSYFRKLSVNKAPDTYVKLCMVNSLGQEMARSKTTTRRAQPNPLYKELFVFQIALFQLTEVTLMVSVWSRYSVKKNEMVGWFTLGLSSTGREGRNHWREVCEARGEQIQRWHVLIDS